MPGVLLACGYAILFGWVVMKAPFFQASGIGGNRLAILFIIKLLAGTALWWVYTYVYTVRVDADIHKYFDDSAVLFSALPEHPGDYLRMMTGIRNDSPYFNAHYYGEMNNWYRQFESSVYNDAHTVIRFNAFVRLFSFGHFHVHTVFASFISLAGTVALYRAFIQFLPELGNWLLAGTFLWPSLLFWTSGPMKECLLMTGMGFFLWSLFGPSATQRRTLHWIIMVVSLALMVQIKSYVLLSLIPPLFALFLSRRSGKHTVRYFVMVITCSVALVLVSGPLFPNYDILELLAVKQKDFIGLVTAAGSGSMIDLPRLSSSPLSFLAAVPHALYVSFLSPFLGLGMGALGTLSALENLAIPFSLFLVWRYHRPWHTVDLPLLLFCMTTVVFLALIMGWATPVVGGLVRYRVPLLPLYAVATLLLIDPERIPEWTRPRSY